MRLGGAKLWRAVSEGGRRRGTVNDRDYYLSPEEIRKRKNMRPLPLHKWGPAFLNLVKKYSPEMLTVIIGLRDGMVSLGYICILLILILYIYAVAGVFVFQENDPWHFVSVEITFITLLRCAFFDGWGDVLYINYYGCNVYDMGVYTEDPLEEGVDGLWLCDKPLAQPVLTVAYFLSFLFIVSLTVLSLIIGAIGDAMMNASLELKRNSFALRVAWQQRDALAVIERRELTKDYNRTQREAIRLLKLAFRGKDVFLEKNFVFSREDPWYRFKKNCEIFSYRCGELADSKPYENFMIVTILGVGVLAGLQTTANQSRVFSDCIDAFNWLIQIIFTFDCAIKIAAEGSRPYHYFCDAWNQFDFVVVVVAYADAIGLIAFQPLFLRLFRLIRVLKLLKRFKQLQVIINAITSCSLSVCIIGGFIFIYLLIYGAIGMQLFGTVDSFHFGNLYMAILSVFQSATYDNWSSVMYVSLYGCDNFEYDGIRDWSKFCVDPPEPNFTAATIYFLFNSVVGGMVLINLFIGLMCSAMIDSYENLTMYNKVDQRVHQVQVKNGLEEGLVEKYRLIFDFLDVTGGMRVGRTELEHGFKVAAVKTTTEEVKRLFLLVDTDQSMFIEFHEFVIFMLHVHHDQRQLKRHHIDTVMSKAPESIKRLSQREMVKSISSFTLDDRKTIIEMSNDVRRRAVDNTKTSCKVLTPTKDAINIPKSDVSSSLVSSPGKPRPALMVRENSFCATDFINRLEQEQRKYVEKSDEKKIRKKSLETAKYPSLDELSSSERSVIVAIETAKKALLILEDTEEGSSRYEPRHQEFAVSVDLARKRFDAHSEMLKTCEDINSQSVLLRRDESISGDVKAMSHSHDSNRLNLEALEVEVSKSPAERKLKLDSKPPRGKSTKGITDEAPSTSRSRDESTVYTGRVDDRSSGSDRTGDDYSDSLVSYPPSEEEDRSSDYGTTGASGGGAKSSADQEPMQPKAGANRGGSIGETEGGRESKTSLKPLSMSRFVVTSKPETQPTKEEPSIKKKASKKLSMSQFVQSGNAETERAESKGKGASEAGESQAKPLTISDFVERIPAKGESDLSPNSPPKPARTSVIKSISISEAKGSPLDAPSSKGTPGSRKKNRAKPAPPTTPSPSPPKATQSREVWKEGDKEGEMTRPFDLFSQATTTPGRGTVQRGGDFKPRMSVLSRKSMVAAPFTQAEEVEEEESNQRRVVSSAKKQAWAGGDNSPSFKPRDPESTVVAQKPSALCLIDETPEGGSEELSAESGIVKNPKEALAALGSSVLSSSTFANPYSMATRTSHGPNTSFVIAPSSGLRSSPMVQANARAIKEYAFFYVKPHANTPLTKQICRGFFNSHGIDIVDEGDVSGTEIDSKLMFEKQYSVCADYALGNPFDITLTSAAADEFARLFGDTFDNLLNEGLIMNCIESCELLQCSNEELGELWDEAYEEGKSIKLANGLFCAQLQPDGETVIYVINGFYKRLRNSYHHLGSSVYYYYLSWISSVENDNMAVTDFNRLVGSADPEHADGASLRGLLYENRNALGLRAKHSRENNFVHASKSVYEAMVERNRWTNLRPEKDPLCAKLYSAGIPRDKLGWWATNPSLMDRDLPSSMRGKRAADLMIGSSFAEAVTISLSVLERKLNTSRIHK